jgi:hypothetical protein
MVSFFVFYLVNTAEEILHQNHHQAWLKNQEFGNTTLLVHHLSLLKCLPPEAIASFQEAIS